MRILIVDDDYHCAHVLSVVIISLDHTIAVSAVSTIEGFNRFVDNINVFDMIFMDIRMPFNGIKMVEHIRPIYDGQIIAYTAYALKGDEQKYSNLGFDGYISKPFTIKKIERIIRGD